MSSYFARFVYGPTRLQSRLGALAYAAVALVQPGTSSAEGAPPLTISSFTESYILIAQFRDTPPQSPSDNNQTIAVAYAVADRLTRKVLVTFPGQAKVAHINNTTVHLHPPPLPNSAAVNRAELQGFYFELQMQPDATFLVVQSCRFNMQRRVRNCNSAEGSVGGRPPSVS